MEKWENRKNFSFSHLCLVGRVEKWRDGTLFCLVYIKNERIENRVRINSQSCPYLIIKKKKVTHYILKKNLCIDGHFNRMKKNKYKKLTQNCFLKFIKKKKWWEKEHMSTDQKKKKEEEEEGNV